MSRTLAAFLADRPEPELREMQAGVQEARQRLRQEEERLKVEESLIGDALARKGRRTPPSGRGGRVKLSRGQVLRVLAGHGQPVTTGEAIKLVRRSHPDVSDSSIRAHIARLGADGKLVQQGRHWHVSEPQELQVEVMPYGQPTEQASPNGDGRDGEDREPLRRAGSQDWPG